jgi:hypothetical protein
MYRSRGVRLGDVRMSLTKTPEYAEVRVDETVELLRSSRRVSQNQNPRTESIDTVETRLRRGEEFSAAFALSLDLPKHYLFRRLGL